LSGLAIACGGQFLIGRKLELVGWLLLLLGSLAAAACLTPGDPDRLPRFTVPGGGWLGGSREKWAFLLMIVVATVMRSMAPDWLKTGCQVDEGFNGRDAIEFLNFPSFRVYAGTNDGQATMFTYQIALFFKIFGIGLGSEHALAVASGVLTCAATYFLARAIAGREMAFVTAMLLACMRWHVNFSRIAYEAIQAPLFQALAFYFLLRGWRLDAKDATRKLVYFALAGAALAFGMNTYTGFRLVPVILAFHVVWKMAVEPGAFRRNAVPMVLLIAAFLLVFSPLGLFALRHWNDFKNRAGMAWFASPVNMPNDKTEIEVLWSTFTKQIQMFHAHGDPSGINNLPGEPMLDLLTGPVFLAGMFWTAFRLLSGENMLLHAWFWATFAVGVVTIPHEAPTARRTLGLVPVIALITAVFAGRLRWEMGAAFGRKGLMIAGGIGVTWLTAIAALNGYQFYGLELHNERVYTEFRHAESQTAELLNRLQSQTGKHAFLLSAELGHPEDYGVASVIDVATGHLQNVSYFQPWGNLAPTDDRNVAFVFRPESRSAFESLLREVYPGGTLTDYGTPYRKVSLYAFVVTKEMQQAVQGLSAEYRPVGGQAVAKKVHDPAITWDMSTASGMALPFQLIWEGSIFAPKRGLYTVGMKSDHAFELTLDGKRLVAGKAGELRETTSELQLVPGYHTVHVTGAVTHLGSRTELLFALTGAPLAPPKATQMLVKKLEPRGWNAAYYPNNSLTGKPVFTRREPFVLFWWGLEADPLENPFSANWDTTLMIPQDGDYKFRGEADDGVSLDLDGKRVGESMRHNFTNQFEASVRLKAGPHKARLGFFQDAGDKAVKLLWQPPGATEWEVVPPGVLHP